jgi:uncharacterized membrane protein YgcG
VSTPRDHTDLRSKGRSPTDHLLDLQSGWTFGGNLEARKNRNVAILIEPSRKQAAMIVGYGLEPILPQQALDQIIDRAPPYLTGGEYLAGMEIAIEGLSELLKSVSQQLPYSVGL